MSLASVILLFIHTLKLCVGLDIFNTPSNVCDILNVVEYLDLCD